VIFTLNSGFLSPFHASSYQNFDLVGGRGLISAKMLSRMRKIYIQIQGTGKEIDDAFHDVEIMEAELRFLQKTLASKKKVGDYPES
jgi:hypothetical protein